MNKHKELLVGRQFTRNPVEEMEVGGGKRFPCTWKHGRNGACPGNTLVRGYARRLGIRVFTVCRGKHIWIGRYE